MKHLNLHKWTLLTILFLSLCITIYIGCGEDPVSASPWADEPNVLAMIHDQIPADSFTAVVNSDPDLKAVVDMIEDSIGATSIYRSVSVADRDSATLVSAVLVGASGDTAVVIRYCSGDSCISARVTGAEDSTVWIGINGPVEEKSIATSFQLRIIDDTAPNPDTTARIADFDTSLISLYRDLSDKIDKPGLQRRSAAPATRRLRILSAFADNSWFNNVFSDLTASMKTSGFTDARDVYYYRASTLDRELTTQRPGDALVIYAHGDSSVSKGRITGMSTGDWFWSGKHYPVTRMKSKIESSSRYGPGILFLAGCKTADMLAELDHPSRITLGFNISLHPGQSSAIVKNFFSLFTGGMTLKQAVDQINTTYASNGIELKVNPGAYTDIKFAELGDFDRPGCRDTCQFARDGSCDDGGAGSSSGACSEGSDCYDCGPREPKAFEGTWHSTAVCTETDAASDKWRWRISLSQSATTISGKINFHKCPGGGAVYYSISGQYVNDVSATLKGTKTGGRGDLNDTTPASVTFTIMPKMAPSPNYAP